MVNSFSVDVERVWHLTGWRLFYNQIKAMLLKKVSYTRRSPVLFFATNFMAVFFVFVAILSARGLQNKDDLPSMKVDLAPYEESQTILAMFDLLMLLPQVERYY